MEIKEKNFYKEQKKKKIFEMNIVKKKPPPASWIYQNCAPMEREYNNKSSQGSG